MPLVRGNSDSDRRVLVAIIGESAYVKWRGSTLSLAWRMRNLSLLLVAVMLAAAWPSAAFAYLDSFETRAVVSSNGEYLLVLLTPPPAERVDRPEYASDQADKGLDEEEIRAWREACAPGSLNWRRNIRKAGSIGMTALPNWYGRCLTSRFARTSTWRTTVSMSSLPS